jgi:hypothetical protein
MKIFSFCVVFVVVFSVINGAENYGFGHDEIPRFVLQQLENTSLYSFKYVNGEYKQYFGRVPIDNAFYRVGRKNLIHGNVYAEIEKDLATTEPKLMQADAMAAFKDDLKDANLCESLSKFELWIWFKNKRDSHPKASLVYMFDARCNNDAKIAYYPVVDAMTGAVLEVTGVLSSAESLGRIGRLPKKTKSGVSIKYIGATTSTPAPVPVSTERSEQPKVNRKSKTTQKRQEQSAPPQRTRKPNSLATSRPTSRSATTSASNSASSSDSNSIPAATTLPPQSAKVHKGSVNIHMIIHGREPPKRNRKNKKNKSKHQIQHVQTTKTTPTAPQSAKNVVKQQQPGQAPPMPPLNIPEQNSTSTSGGSGLRSGVNVMGSVQIPHTGLSKKLFHAMKGKLIGGVPPGL